MSLQSGFVIFWLKDFGTKPAHKMLVKLTPRGDRALLVQGANSTKPSTSARVPWFIAQVFGGLNRYLYGCSEEELEEVFEWQARKKAAVVAVVVLVTRHLVHVVHHDHHAREAEYQWHLQKSYHFHWFLWK